MTVAAVTAFANYDMLSVIRSVYHVHDCIFKLGIVPVYRGGRGIFLLAVSTTHIIVEYAVTIKESLENREIDMAILYALCAYMELLLHAYTTQFCCLMEVLQTQMRALTSGLMHENQWYLESIINVQCHLLDTTKYVYAMYVRMISMAIVHSAIAMMTHAYEVTKELNHTLVVIVFELIVMLCIVDACGQIEFKVRKNTQSTRTPSSSPNMMKR